MVYAVLVVFVVVLALEIIRATEIPIPTALIAMAVAIVALLLARLALQRTVLARCAERPIPVWGSVAVGAGLGIITSAPFTIALAVGKGAFSLPTPGLLVGNVVRSGVLFPALAYVAGLRWWYAGERGRAQRQLIEAEARRMRAGSAVASTRGLIIDVARRELGPSHREAAHLLQAAAASESPDDWSRAAGSLRTAARSAVRSTSHDLWVDSRDRAASIRWRSVVPGALARYPLPVLVPSLIMLGVVSSRAEATRVSVPLVLLALVVAVGVLVAGYMVGRVFIAWRPGWAVAVTVLTVTLVTTAALTAALAMVDRDPSVVGSIGAPLALLAATVAVSVVLMIRDSGAAVIQALLDDRARADAQRAALEEINAELSRDLASHLHGTVQPSLMAAAVALDEAVRTGDADALRQAAAMADQALSMGVEIPPTAPARTLGEAIDQLRDRWKAMLDIDVQVAPPTALHRPGDDIAKVLDECLNNAVVHGMATRVGIRIECGDDQCTVRVVDDGAGPAGGVPGLGAALLDRVTDGDWSLAPGDGGGTVATARLRPRGVPEVPA